MPVDYSQIPTPDLEALKSGRLGQVSTATLQMLSSSIEAEPKKTFWDAMKSMPIGGGDLPIGLDTGEYTKAIKQSTISATPEIGAALGAIGGPWGVPLGYLIGKQAQTLMSSPTLPSGQTMATQAISDLPNAAMIGMTGPIAGKAIGSTLDYLGPKMQQGAERLYSSAIKMPLSRKWTKVRGEEQTTKIREATRKGLEEEIPPTEFGREKIRGIKEEHGEQIGAMAKDIPSGPYDLDDIILRGVSKAVDRAKKGEDIAGELTRIKEWAEKYRLAKSSKPSGEELEKWKVELYKRANYDKTSGKSDSLIETIRKGVAHEMRLDLEKVNPALRMVNKDWAAANDLEEALERAIPRQNNNAILDLGTKVLIGKETMPWAIVNKVLGVPRVKAKIAFAMDKMGRSIVGPRPVFVGGEMSTSGLPPEQLPAPAWQMGNQFQLGRGPSTLDEMYPQGMIGGGTPRLGLPSPTQIQLGNNVSWSQLASEIQSPPKPYATLVPKPISKYKAQNPNLIAEYMKQLKRVK